MDGKWCRGDSCSWWSQSSLSTQEPAPGWRSKTNLPQRASQTHVSLVKKFPHYAGLSAKQITLWSTSWLLQRAYVQWFANCLTMGAAYTASASKLAEELLCVSYTGSSESAQHFKCISLLWLHAWLALCQFMVNWFHPYKRVTEYMQMDSMLKESRASEIYQWCHRLCRSSSICKMEAVSLCTCSRFSEKTPDISLPYTHKDQNPQINRIRLLIRLRSTKTSQAATLLSSYIDFLFLLIIQKSSCIGLHCWSIWPHILSLAAAKTWRLEMNKRTEKVCRMHSLSTHLASDKLCFGDVLAQ